jgi:uncharacterized protein
MELDKQMSSQIITLELIKEIHSKYCLNWLGIHGVRHWVRVREFGLILAEKTGADQDLVELFAVLHDSQRKHEALDKRHGPRSAVYAKSLNGKFFQLTENQLDLLTFAITHHTNMRHHDDITVQSCWDADRLDIGRILFMKPNPKYFNTDYAKTLKMRDYAYSRRHDIPEIVKSWS